MAVLAVPQTLDDLIKKLSTLPVDAEQSILSLYLQAHGHDREQRKRARVYFEQLLRSPEIHRLQGSDHQWEQKIRTITSQAEGFLNAKDKAPFNGVAFFVGGPLGEVVTYASYLTLPNDYYVLNIPALSPLVGLRDEYEPLCLCRFNQEEARIVEIDAGVVSEQHELGQEISPHHKQGGWAQARLQRKHEEGVEQFFREIARQLGQRAVHHPKMKFALVGQRTELPILARFLPDQVGRRLIAQEIADRSLANGGLVRKGLEILEAYDRQKERSKLEELSLGRIAQGFGSIKSEKVYQAIKQGQVETLLIRKGFEEAGSICLECHTILAEYRQTCPYCGHPVSVAPLREILVYETLRHHGKICWLPPVRKDKSPPYGVLYRERARLDYHGN